MIKTKLSENDFFAMWDLKFKKCLLYSLIYGYFVYNEWTKGVWEVRMRDMMSKIYVLKHYCKLEKAYE
jgi:hypothetical protein